MDVVENMIQVILSFAQGKDKVVQIFSDRILQDRNSRHLTRLTVWQVWEEEDRKQIPCKLTKKVLVARHDSDGKSTRNEPCRDINTNGLQKLVAVIQQFREPPYHIVIRSSTNGLEIISPVTTNGIQNQLTSTWW